MLLRWVPKGCVNRTWGHPWRTSNSDMLIPACPDAGFMETCSLSRTQNDRGSVPPPFAGAQNWAYRLHTPPISALPSLLQSSQYPVPQPLPPP